MDCEDQRKNDKTKKVFVYECSDEFNLELPIVVYFVAHSMRFDPSTGKQNRKCSVTQHISDSVKGQITTLAVW